jgi:dTDP-4-dehydrorhamnose reductase
MRLYVIGAEGQVARALREAAAAHADIAFGCGARPDVDLLRPESIEQALDAFKPDIVINPAAYTAVDRAEAEPDQAFALNRDGAVAVATAAARLGVPIMQLSTDYVYDGRKPAPYVETDPVNPQGVYGRSKLAGEIAVAAANAKHIILRTAWVYAPFGNNFVRTMLRLASERDGLRVVDDQQGCPTYAPDIATAILRIAQTMHRSGWHDSYGGVTHLAGPDAMTWCAFARRIMAELTAQGGRAVPVEAIATADYPTPAVRPANSRLSTIRLAEIFDVELPSLDISLANCMARLRAPSNRS